MRPSRWIGITLGVATGIILGDARGGVLSDAMDVVMGVAIVVKYIKIVSTCSHHIRVIFAALSYLLIISELLCFILDIQVFF